ncbi:MAG: hypothetical protein AAF633_06530 [Chloroflexota bacterium]
MPKRSDYEAGTPPQSGTYTITQNGDSLTFDMAWVDAKGESHSMSYSEICDGQLHSMADSPVADEISLTPVSKTQLDSIAKKGGHVVLSASRRLVSNNEMQVTQSGRLPDGNLFNNVSYYRRA